MFTWTHGLNFILTVSNRKGGLDGEWEGSGGGVGSLEVGGPVCGSCQKQDGGVVGGEGGPPHCLSDSGCQGHCVDLAVCLHRIE